MATFSGSLPIPNFYPALNIFNTSPEINSISFRAAAINTATGSASNTYPALLVSRVAVSTDISVYLAVQPPFDRVSICDEPLSITVTALSNTEVKVLFSFPVINNFALTNPQNYIFTPSLTVESVVPNSVNDPNYVILTVSSMLQQTYSLNILTIEPV